MNNDLTLLIIGYDGYSDLWNDCISLLKRFWKDCPYKIVFVNNELDIKWDGVVTINAGKDAEWSMKVQKGLDYCESEYVCLLLEDFLVGKTVKTSDVSILISLMKQNDIHYLKLVDMNSVLKPRNKKVKNNRYIRHVRYCDDYGISLQPSIWKKSFLIKKLGNDNYNAWIFEFNRVSESQPKNKKYMPNVWFDTRNIIHFKHGVIQGQYLPKTISYFKKQGIDLNIQRDVMSVSKYRKIRAISFLKAVTPINLRPSIKRFLEKKGMKFVSTTRNNNV